MSGMDQTGCFQRIRFHIRKVHLWGSLTGARKENQRSEMRFFYSPLFKALLVIGALSFLLLLFTGCMNAKHLKIQIPALLDVEFEYNDDKGTSDPESIREVFTDD